MTIGITHPTLTLKANRNMYTEIKQIDCTQDEYFALDGISNSDVNLFQRSPHLYKAKLEGMYSTPVSDPMRMGSAFDCLLLEPHLWADQYVVTPLGMETPTTSKQVGLVKAMRSGMDMQECFRLAGYARPDPKTFHKLKPYTEFLAEVGSRATISADEYTSLKNMLDSVRDNPVASQAVSECTKQVIYTAIHEETGLAVKGMLDMVGEDYVCDLKTTGEEVSRFPRKIWNYNYDRQIAHYASLASVDVCRFIAVERGHLNECDVFELHIDRVESGREKMNQALVDIKASSVDNYTHRAHFYTTKWKLI